MPAAGRASSVPVATVDVCQEVDIATAPSLWSRLEQALRHRPERLVVDLSRCSFIDMTGVSVLVRAHASAGRQGTVLVLLAPQRAVLRVLSLTRVLDRFLVVTNDVR